MTQGTSDHNVTETAFDAIKCKASAVTLGYYNDSFLRFFVEKPTRRIPLIHRGYYLRHVAIARCVELFFSQYKMSTRINIVSLGAGFDTLFFRLLAQRQFTGSISFTEVDCNAIVDAKKVLLNDKQVRAQLFQKYANDLTVAESMEDNVAWQCHVSCATYSLIACDLGDIQRLNSSFKTAGVDRNLPTLILAECVLSYLAPEKGTELLQWLAATFPSGSIAVYDPIALQGGSEKNNEQSDRETIEGSDAFSSTLQRYFAVKGCSLRGATGYRTAADHARRFLAFAHWHNCRILDMNSVFAACTSVEEKRRIASLEPFDEYADWVLCNAHYAIYLADNNKRLSENDGEWTSQFVSRAYQHRYLLTSTCVLQQQESQPVIIRTFQNEDLAAVRSLFENTHLEFARNSRAVREFVVKRLRGPVGDMYDVHRAFQIPASTGISNSGFWVAELSGAIVGCVGLKPIAGDQRAAELCRLSVSSAVRRRGVASALVKYAEAFAVSCGAFDEICLDTIGTMEGAQHLYRSLGYIEQLQSKMQYSSFKLLRFRKTL
ncbi:leucine carboxyl methyltransferase 2-like [Plasmopara halstedii]|uniref:[phosphatase 2A protein]-leucine-carboxy methyltransferase n=1 Tax=Plasmopara halstedii TaxID=4781 RepID=A0A0P1B7Y0_PLAHL|nr:leucine carboxyl methyltransferase 2-like [Plasmopara halstedii]CEG50489.1 leucine carboxyl methyltransferase 2-like [Plasmopara halstedii]|eukprot:XP_024586858.1 leucine carboxyl methyltransferase 2-like [Plasmopara halstedii]